MTRFLFLLLCFLPAFLHAEVYSLWPFPKNGPSFADPSEVLPARAFWKEDLRINGTSVRMDVSLVDLAFDTASAILLKQFPNAQFAKNVQSLLLSVPGNNGSSKRIYLVNVRGTNPLLQFTMEIPGNRRAALPADWPDNIPLLPGASDLNVMAFPARRAVYASCRLPGTTRPQLLSEMDTRLKSLGWRTASAEIANPFRATGEVYYKEKPLEILLLGVGKSDDKGTTITVYTRPVEPAKKL